MTQLSDEAKEALKWANFPSEMIDELAVAPDRWFPTMAMWDALTVVEKSYLRANPDDRFTARWRAQQVFCQLLANELVGLLEERMRVRSDGAADLLRETYVKLMSERR